MRTLRASEIGAFLFCQRAWWYQHTGQPSENQAEFASGSQLHYRHGRAVIKADLLRLAGYALLLAAVVLAAIAVIRSVI
jgi:hypothetical protein